MKRKPFNTKNFFVGIGKSPNSDRDFIMPCAVKASEKKPVYRFSLKINHIDSLISFGKNWLSRFKWDGGDHFFLNLNSVL
jgi:hypothetical protein